MATRMSDRAGGIATVGSYEEAIDTLDAELRRVEEVFRGLSESEWTMSTKLVPLDPKLKHWTAFELAGHFDISIGLARMLMAERKDGQPGRDRVSFFIFPRSEVAPVVYDYAYKMVEGKAPKDMPGVLHETFSKTIEEARKTPPEHVGSGYYALMRIDALGRDTIATPAGMAMTAAILDELLARRTVAGRPSDLKDDLAWVRAASGRAKHPDPRLPLIG